MTEMSAEEALRRAREQNPTRDETKEAAEKPTRNILAATTAYINGASLQEIVDRFGYSSHAAARAAIEQQIASSYDPGSADAARKKALAQLQSMQRALLPQALRAYLDEDGKVPNPEQLSYAREALKVIDRIIRLQGLDAPQVMALVTPNSQEFESIVNSLLQATGHTLTEGDIDAIPEHLGELTAARDGEA